MAYLRFHHKIFLVTIFTSGLWTTAIAQPLTIAHRGASGYLPEHTLASTAMAHAWNVDYIEPDLVMTKDKRIVILHDIHLETTTNVKKIYPKRARKNGRFFAADFTLKEIKVLKAHERIDLKTGKAVFPNRFPVDSEIFSVPTFEEYIELVQGLNQATGRNVGIYVEIKAPGWHRSEGLDITKKTIEILRKYGYETPKNKAFIQSFESASLKRLKTEFNCKIPLTQLIGENIWGLNHTDDYDQMKTPKGLAYIKTYAQGIGPWIGHVIKPKGIGMKPTALVAQAKKIGLKVHVYTLRKDKLPKGISSLTALGSILKKVGVDGWFTDFGDKLVH